MYISVPNWRQFQHYDPTKRQPPWIKLQTSLMSNDDYLGLSAGARGVLHGIWMEYARSRCELPGDTLTLTRRLSMKVSKRTLDSLNHAGFIRFVASKTLAEGYHIASVRAHAREVEVDVDRELEKKPPLTPPSVPARQRAPDELWDTLVQELGPAETESERGRRNKALKELRDIGATPDLIHQRCAAYRRHFPEAALTATALVHQWSHVNGPTPHGTKLGPRELMELANRKEPLQ